MNFINRTLGFIVVAMLTLMGCQSKKKANTFIFGDIKNSPTSYITLYYNGVADTLPINEGEDLRIELPLSNPSYYKFINGNKTFFLYLTPGDTLHFKYDYNQFYSTFLLGGNNTSPQGYLIKKQFLLEESWKNLNYVNGLKPNEFNHYCDSVFNLIDLKLNDLKQGSSKITNAFIETETDALHYQKAIKQMEYSMESSYAFLINENTFYKNFDQLVIDDSVKLPTPTYREFVQTYVDWRALKLMANYAELFPYEITLIKMQVVSRNFSTGPVKDELLYTLLKDHLRFYGLKDTDALFKTFAFQCGNNRLKQELLAPYEKYLSLNNGGAAPEISFRDLEGKEYHLKSFKGKNICIDVWATWCTPCLRERPYFDSLSNVFKNKNIEFISLSIDEDITKWQVYCSDYKKEHNQFWVVNQKDFTSNYLIKTIPHFILIDSNGNVININAPRPSGKLGDYLEKIEDKPKI